MSSCLCFVLGGSVGRREEFAALLGVGGGGGLEGGGSP